MSEAAEIRQSMRDSKDQTECERQQRSDKSQCERDTRDQTVCERGSRDCE